jgi:dTDP-4-amino-4,6-dideoxygalactose transaminase
MEGRKMIPLFKVFMHSDIDEELLRVIHSGWIGQGPKVKEFEEALGKRFTNPNVLGLSSGTHGLTLALRLAGVGPDDEVITTPLTCTATNTPILQQLARPVWADIKDDFNIDPESIEARITDKTKAIVVMHWGGYPCSMEEIGNIATKYEIPLIEDAAHAYGATYKGTDIGQCFYSDFTMMSFQAIKHLTCVDGGALFSASHHDYTRGKLLRWYGIDRESPRTDFRCEEDIKEWGYKFHMNDVAATIGLGNMRQVERNLASAKSIALEYDLKFSKVPGIKLTQVMPDRTSSNWLYTIQVENRSEFVNMMTRNGISVSRVHERDDKHTFTKDSQCDLPNLDRIIQKQISIPCGWWLTEADVHHIMKCVKSGW